MTPTGLTYYPDNQPGITRRWAGRGFSYRSPDGTRIDDLTERARINAMAVPPAYTDVWITPRKTGHLQATGRDAALRKQYRYHPDWSAFRSEKKFDDLPRFGLALPRLRAAIHDGLEEAPGSRVFALSAVLGLIDRLSLRPGHQDYADANGSYGATTLRSKHLKISDAGTELHFRAKSGTKVDVCLSDKRLARALHKLDDLPGAPLAKWIEDGAVRLVTPDMVAAHMAEITGEEGLTPKTFRTWNGTVAAMETALRDADLTINAMAQAASERLGNTPTIARNSYIHPDVIALAEQDHDARLKLARATAPARLRKAERAVLALIG